MEPLFKGINVVSVSVTDLDVARAFYRDTLGLGEPLYDLPEAGWIEFSTGRDAGNLSVVPAEPGWQPSTGTTLVLDVDDCHAAVDELRRRGVRCDDAQALPGFVTFASFYDPFWQQVADVQPRACVAPSRSQLPGSIRLVEKSWRAYLLSTAWQCIAVHLTGRNEMDELQFFVPVRIVPEPGQSVIEIYGVEDALAFLRNWPTGRQGPVYKAAFNCCSGAMDGMIKPDDARKSFANFARITGILAKDAFEKIAINKDGEVLPLPSQH